MVEFPPSKSDCPGRYIFESNTDYERNFPDDQLPPVQRGEIMKEKNSIILKNVFWYGTLLNQMENI
jgi:hypothetical protein